MDRLRLIIAISAITLFAVCAFVALVLFQGNDEVSDLNEVSLPTQLQRDTEHLTREEVEASFAKYSQAMIDVFSQHGYKVQLEAESFVGSRISRMYAAHINGCLETEISFELWYELGSKRATIRQAGKIVDMDCRYQSFNIDLWSDLLYALSGGQIPHGEVASFLSCDYELLSWHETGQGWPNMLIYSMGEYDREKVRADCLYGIYYRVTPYSEELYAEIFHLGGL